MSKIKIVSVLQNNKVIYLAVKHRFRRKQH